MPLDGYGDYDPPSPENPVRAGTLIKSEDFNTTIDDISDALSTAFYKDGQAAMEADLNMGHNNIVQVSSIQNDTTLRIKAGDDASVNIVPSMQINSGIIADGITDMGGADASKKLVRTNTAGMIDGSLFPFAPSPESTYSAVAGEALSAGDFIYIGSDKKVRPCDNTNEYLATGFVLNAVAENEIVDVYYAGYNNQVEISGIPTAENFVYIADAGANKLTYQPETRKQIVGIAVGDHIVRFTQQLSQYKTPYEQLLYYGNI